MTWPSSDCGIGLPLPFTGGSSEKSMYSLASTLAIRFLGRAGTPIPMVTSGAEGCEEVLLSSLFSSLLMRESICEAGSLGCPLSSPSLLKLWTPASRSAVAGGGSHGVPACPTMWQEYNLLTPAFVYDSSLQLAPSPALGVQLTSACCPVFNWAVLA